MTLLPTLAWRNLGRRPMRTFLTTSALAGATALLILALCMLFGMVWDLFAAATEDYHGHAVVARERYLDERVIQLTLDERRPPTRILDDPEVLARAPRVRGFVLLSAGEGPASQSQPAELLGVDPEAERGVSRLPRRVAQGRFLDPAGKRELVLGRGLARRLEANLGAEVAAMGQAADGSIAAERFKVVGILDGGDKLRDSSLALTSLHDLQAALALEGKVHEWALRLRHPLQAQDWARRVSTGEATVAPWNRFLPQIAAMLKLMRIVRWIYAGIFYFAVVLVATNTISMAILERLREYAIMGAVGLKPARLAGLVMLEALFMSCGAALAGGVLGSLAALRLQSHPLDFRGSVTSITWSGTTLQPVYRAAFAWEHVLLPVAITALIGVAVAFLPAWKLYRMRPVEVLREG